MIDLTRVTTPSPDVHTVDRDPGHDWAKLPVPALDAPPDADIRPDPAATWSADAVRTGLCGTVSPRIVRLADGSCRVYYTQILPSGDDNPTGANDYDKSTTRILSARSTDGITWTPEPGVRVTAEQGGAGNRRVVSSEVVPHPDGSGRLRMYFEACAGAQRGASFIRSAVSEDGLAWQVEDGDRFSAPNAYFSAVRILFLADGRLRLFVNRRGAGVVSAISTNCGDSFEEEGIRLPDDDGAFAIELLRLPSGTYRCYYSARTDDAAARAGGGQKIVTALSDDGLTWSRDVGADGAGAAVVPTGEGPDARKCSEMCVYPLPGDTPGYGMLYEGCDGTTPNARGVWRVAGAQTR